MISASDREAAGMLQGGLEVGGAKVEPAIMSRFQSLWQQRWSIVHSKQRFSIQGKRCFM